MSDEPKQQKIKNLNYRKFLDEGIISILTQDQIKAILDNIKGEFRNQGRALVCCLYLTGARPIEALRIIGKDISLEKSHIIVKMSGAKRGLSRSIYIAYKNPLAKELYKYAKMMPPEMLLFHKFINRYERRVLTKNGAHTRIETTGKVNYYIKRWSAKAIPEGITAYYLRHNRFSSVSQAGASMEDIMLMKGARDIKSVSAYIHMSVKRAKDISRRIK